MSVWNEFAQAIDAQTRRFLEENRELDRAFRDGTLGEFLDAQLKPFEPVGDEQRPDGGAADVAATPGGAVVEAEGG